MNEYYNSTLVTSSEYPLVAGLMSLRTLVYSFIVLLLISFSNHTFCSYLRKEEILWIRWYSISLIAVKNHLLRRLNLFMNGLWLCRWYFLKCYGRNNVTNKWKKQIIDECIEKNKKGKKCLYTACHLTRSSFVTFFIRLYTHNSIIFFFFTSKFYCIW